MKEDEDPMNHYYNYVYHKFCKKATPRTGKITLIFAMNSEKLSRLHCIATIILMHTLPQKMQRKAAMLIAFNTTFN